MIKVTVPNGNEEWTQGSVKNITWITAGINANVRIVLMRNGVKLGVITQDIPASKGFHPWTVGQFYNGKAQPGKGYTIKLVEQGSQNTINDQSDFPFSIVVGHHVMQMQQPPASVIGRQQTTINPAVFKNGGIGIISPKQGDAWLIGNGYHIKWKMSGVTLRMVKIELTGNSYNSIIIPSVLNNGDYLWNIPNHIPPGSYRVKVSANVAGVSDWFSIKSPAPQPTCNTGNQGNDLECLINNYRKSKGLPPIPHNAALRKVADTHVKDLAAYHPENQCKGNTHSWSNHGPWKGGCYDPSNSSTYPIMWDKPKEIAGYNNYGYEIACQGCTSPADSLNTWKGSPPHHDVILNKGMWSQAWSGMGAAIYGGYSVVWFAR